MSGIGEGSKKAKLPNFSTEEDVALCHAYLAISEDPIIGNSQQANAFWAGIHKQFFELCLSNRTSNSLKCRWNFIRPRFLKNAIKWSTLDVDMSPPATMSPNLDVNLDSINLDYDEQGESVPETQYTSEIPRPKKRATGRKAAKIAKNKKALHIVKSVSNTTLHSHCSMQDVKQWMSIKSCW
ncbi:unnamed protein product [Prunus armeniaca]|uniref:No apical meristem-associated C-terminal domain-containing protein n=1 Tax=Prunus armeniaca TaxID=36596 RepID=A0A6J5VBR3_PRUAR|nr:unnamed protein product [Prunus armeniaca]